MELTYPTCGLDGWGIALIGPRTFTDWLLDGFIPEGLAMEAFEVAWVNNILYVLIS